MGISQEETRFSLIKTLKNNLELMTIIIENLKLINISIMLEVIWPPQETILEINKLNFKQYFFYYDSSHLQM